MKTITMITLVVLPVILWYYATKLGVYMANKHSKVKGTK